MFLKDLLDESKPTPAPKFDKTYSLWLSLRIRDTQSYTSRWTEVVMLIATSE